MRQGVKVEQAADMKHITHHAQDAKTCYLRADQPAARPDHDIVGQRAKQHQHVLCLKALLIALGETQPLLVAFEGGFDAPTAQVIKGHIRQQDGNRVGCLRTRAAQHREHLFCRQRANQHAVSEGAVLSTTAHSNASHRTDIAESWLGDPSKRAFGPDRVLDPLGDALGQAEHSRSRILFRHDKIAPRKQPIEIVQGPSTSIHADNGARAFRRIQFQGRLCCLHQRLQGLHQLDITGKETINDHLLIQSGQHAAHLPSPAVVLSGKVALGRKSRFGTAWHATHVHIQQLEPSLVIVLISATVLPIDHIQCVLHLPDILLRTRIQCLLHHRLLRTRLASKGMLQGRISSQARIDFYHPVGSGQQADKGVIELVHWRMFDGLLPNLDLGTDRTKQIKLTQLHSQGCQTRSRAKMLRCRCVRLVHGDAPPNEIFFGSSLAMEHRHAFGKLFKSWQTCRYFGRNLGSLDSIRKGFVIVFLAATGLIKNSGKIIDLNFADLREVKLRGMKKLDGISLEGANLKWADCTGAVLTNVNFQGADLSYANLSETDLSGADFNDADLSGADLSGAKVTLEQLKEAQSLKGAT